MVEIKLYDNRLSLNYELELENNSKLTVHAFYDRNYIGQKNDAQEKGMLASKLENAFKEPIPISPILIIEKIRKIFSDFKEDTLILKMNGQNYFWNIVMEDGNLYSYRRTEGSIQIIALNDNRIQVSYDSSTFERALQLQQLVKSEIERFPKKEITIDRQRRHVKGK